MRRLLALALLIIASVTAVAIEAPRRQPPAIANEARLAGDNARTRFVLDLDRTIEISAFPLADPYRVVVDLPETEFRLAPQSGREGRGLITAFRFGQFAPGRSRIVLDIREPALIDRAFVLPPADGQPARLVVDVARASREEFLRAVERAQRQAPERPQARQANLTTGTTTLGSVPPPPPEERRRAELPLVVLDPGHGGVDVGASAADGTQEKAIVLEFARALRTALERTGRVRVVLTRDDDEFVRLDDRVRFARDRQAALFLSIHADSLSRFLGVSGASVYTLSERASDEEAAAYAERENRSDAIAGVETPPDAPEVADILFDLMHRETKNFSVHFARLLVEELRPHVRLVRNPHRFAGFRVLRAPDIPSALLELGYLTNRADLRQLMNPQWRARTADAIARAILAHLATSQAARASGG